MKEKIENNFGKAQEKLSTTISGKELAYILVNIRDSIKIKEKLETLL